MIWVYDLEVFKNFFSATFVHRDSDETHVFTSVADTLSFLKTHVKGLIGFNNIFYDSQILDFIKINSNCNQYEIYEFSRYIITEKKIIYKPTIPQLDLYKINHFDRFKVSLKVCELRLNLPVYTMPINYDEDVTDFEKILKYNLADVIATKALYKYTLPLIDLRKSTIAEYKVSKSIINMSNTSVGKELFLNLYCKFTGKDYWEVKQGKTIREKVLLKDVIDERIEFKTYSLQTHLEILKKSNLNLVTEPLEYYVKTRTASMLIAKGGLHSTMNNYIVESDDEYKVIDIDFSSFYPFLLFELGIYPQHLGEDFCKVLKQITFDRVDAKNKGLKTKAEALKISINSIYGCLKDEYSFLFDAKALYSVTLNGQLLLLMLCERLEEIGQIVYANTDGVTCKVHVSNVKKLYEICENFKEVFNCPMEFVEFKKCIIRDVNNYINIPVNGKPKLKGEYKYDETLLQKDHSNRASKYAVYKYYTENIPIEQTINECSEEYFYMGAKSDAGFLFRYIKEGLYVEEKLPEVIRYCMTTNGGVLAQNFSNMWKFLHVHPIKGKSFKSTIISNMDHSKLNIDKSFYIFEAKKLLL